MNRIRKYPAALASLALVTLATLALGPIRAAGAAQSISSNGPLTNITPSRAEFVGGWSSTRSEWTVELQMRGGSNEGDFVFGDVEVWPSVALTPGSYRVGPGSTVSVSYEFADSGTNDAAASCASGRRTSAGADSNSR